ncbi:hypothetical protein GCM10010994_10100 [Chelatococcus reniformis]|uniref:SsuA/THI5-like domain-containing protein n=2 Tax=Chelatococcus reniformis TaxID=1494448 RepID=A0A916X9B1_9HYPH|nr:hypothetical protein GCM10010994_10100 [Chelatococcus reniformis]
MLSRMTAAAAGSAALGLLLVAGLVDRVDAAGPDEAPLAVVRIAAVSGSVMPQDFRAGIQKGFFKKHGLDIKITELATGTNNITAAVQGSADIAYADIFAGLSSIKNGFDIGLVAPHNGAGPYQFLLVRQDSERRAFKDLPGATIALGAPPQFKAITSAVLASQGVDPKTVKFTIVPDQTTFGAVLQSRQADVISTSSAVNAYQWLNQYKLHAIGDSDKAKFELTKDSPIAGWWSTSAWFAANKPVAIRFRDALRETIRWYATLSDEERAAFVKEQTKIDLVALDKQTPGVLAAATVYFGFGKPVDLARLRDWIRTGNEYANVPTGVDLDKHIFETSLN